MGERRLDKVSELNDGTKWLTPTTIGLCIAGQKSLVARMEQGRGSADRLLGGLQSEVDDVDADNKCGGNCCGDALSFCMESAMRWCEL